MDSAETENQIAQFCYQPSWRSILFLLVICGSFVVTIIALSSGRVFDWLLALFFAATGVLGFLDLVVCRARNQRILLTEGSIVLPKSRWSSEAREIRFEELRDVRFLNGRRTIQIEHTNGTSKIAAMMLPDKASFDAVAAHLMRSSQKELTGPKKEDSHHW